MTAGAKRRMRSIGGALGLLAILVGREATAQEPPPPGQSPPGRTAPATGAADVASGVRVIRSLLEQRRFIEAAQAGEKLVKEHPDDADAWISLAYVHLSPDWSFRRDARAASAAQRAIRAGGRRSDAVAALAIASARLTEYDEALKLIAEMCDATPPRVAGEQLAELLVLRADLALKRGGDTPEARAAVLADLDRALVAAPRSSGARVLRAEALMNADRHADALRDVEMALEVAPGSKQAHAAARICRHRTGDAAGAKRHYEIWKRLNRLTDSVASASAPVEEERRTTLRELSELNPRDLERRAELAALEFRLGDAAAAVRQCDALLALRPGFAPWMRLREQAAAAAPAAVGGGG
jgi:tetratricopeptide (TPR) repeat protein